MLSYKQFKALNESVMPSFTLGLANPANLGINSPFGAFQEAKKMAKKKMIGDEEESGDGEMVPPASEKDEPDVDVDMGDDDMDDMDDAGCNKCSRMSRKKSKKKMWSDEDDASVDDSDEEDEDEDVDGDVDSDVDADSDVDDAAPDDEDEESGEDLADKGGMGGMGMGKAGPMFSKKSKKKCGADMGGEGKEEPDEGDVDMQFSKKKSKKNLKKEETEDAKWWNSVKNMVASNPNEKFSDGWTEYQSAEFTPIDTDNLTQAVRTEPQPGEVGFAPQQMGGSFFS